MLIFFRSFADLSACKLTFRVNKIIEKTVLGKGILAFFLCFVLSVSMVYGAEAFAVEGEEETEKNPGIDRWAFKTNAFEWLLTIPNFGVEYDLKNSI